MTGNISSNSFSGNVTCPKRSMSYMPTSRIIIGHYVIPWLLIIGVTGNVLNLLVLNSKGMRTKTNALLAAMAVADLCFLILMVPTELQVFESVALKDWYRYFLAHHKMNLAFLRNWFATSSTWMAVAVTAERVFAIKMPLHAKFYWTNGRVAILIVTVFLANCLIHLYNVFWFRLIMLPLYCSNGAFAYEAYFLVPLNETAPAFLYVQISRIFVPHISVTIPFFILLILNSFLVYYLHQNRRAMASATNAPQLRLNELKVTLTVAVIVVTFTICSAPSVAVYLYDTVVTYTLHSTPYTVMFFNLSILSNYLVVVGKASNFVLYCSASNHFRRRLIGMFCAKRTGGPTRCSSRASSSLRRTTLTSLLASAIADLPFHNNRDRRRNSADCSIAAGGRRSKESVEFINMKNMETKKPKTAFLKNTTDRRRHSSQQQTNPTDILSSMETDTWSLLENRRYSSPMK